MMGNIDWVSIARWRLSNKGCNPVNRNAGVGSANGGD